MRQPHNKALELTKHCHEPGRFETLAAQRQCSADATRNVEQ